MRIDVTKIRILLLFLVLCATFVTEGWCADRYVDPNKPDNTGDGFSWATAKKTISAGYSVTSTGDTIHLKNAVHTLTQNIDIHWDLAWVNENEDNNYQLCPIDVLDYRFNVVTDITNNFTGITFRNSTAEGCIRVGAEATGNFSYCRFFNNINDTHGGAIQLNGSQAYRATGVFNDCLFDSNFVTASGAAIYTHGAVLSCNNCTFQDNEAIGGGAAVRTNYCTTLLCISSFTGCSFLHNTGGGNGGAICITSGECHISGCKFEDNSSSNLIYGIGAGGAIYTADGGKDSLRNITITNSTFLRNSSTADGGGVRLINTFPREDTEFTVANCLFSHNVAKNGGGLHCGAQSCGTVKNCIFSYNEAYYKNAGGLYNSGTVDVGGWMIVENCLLYYNTAQEFGGGMCIAKYPWTIIRNCSFYGNTAGIDGDQLAGRSHVPVLEKATLINTICWGSGEHNQILGRYGNTFESVSFCCFPEGKLSDSGATVANNVYGNPQFRDIVTNDYHLKPNSSCIDRGTDVGLNEDLDGNPVPIGFGVDIGAYEFLNHVGCPSYTLAEDPGYFLWQDADDREWHLRWSGDSIKTYHYTGIILTNSHFTDVSPYSYEGNDQLTVGESIISFDAYAGAGEDGIDFFVPPGSQVSFDMYIDEIEHPEMVHVGHAGTSPGNIPFTITGLPSCVGDFDGDGDVDGSDLSVFAVTFGTTNGNSNFDRRCDFDNDRDVDGRDLAIFSAEFGKTDCQYALDYRFSDN